MPGPSKHVERHLDQDALAAAIDTAQKEGKARLVRRLCFIRNLYAGDSVSEAAVRVGVTQPTGSRWADAWNEEGVAGLEPEFGGGRPPKLTIEEREQFKTVLERYQPFTMAEIHHLLEDGFGVSYSQRHLSRLLSNLELRDVVCHPTQLSRSDGDGDAPRSNVQGALGALASAVEDDNSSLERNSGY